MKALTKILFIFCFFAAGLYAEAVLKGDFLTVDHKNQLWILKGNVSLLAQKYRLEAMEMTYYRSLKKLTAQGMVRVFLLEENRAIESEFFEKNGSLKVFKGNPLRVVEKNGEKQTFAQTLEVREEPQGKILTFMGNVRVIEKDSLITAGKLVYDDREKKALLQDSARIEKPSDQLVLQSASLTYHEKTKTSVFETPVKIQRKEAEIEGEKGQYQEKEDLIELTGGVSYHEKKKKRVIRGQKLFSAKEKDQKIFVFQEEVEVQDGDFQGFCQQLDYLEEQEVITLKGQARLADPKKDLEIESGVIAIDQKKDQIYFLGTVSIRQKDKMISGGMGVYDRKTSSIIVQGNPSYRKGQDTARAERIVLNTDTNEVRMMGNFQGSFKPEEKERDSGE